MSSYHEMKRICRICLSPSKTAIEKLLDNKTEFRAIAKKFKNEFNTTLHNCEQSIANHRRHREEMDRILQSNENKKQALASLLAKIKEQRASLDDVANTAAVIAYENLNLKEDKIGPKEALKMLNLAIKFKISYSQFLKAKEPENAFIKFLNNSISKEIV